jgi:hypothetical protein
LSHGVELGTDIFNFTFILFLDVPVGLHVLRESEIEIPTIDVNILEN